MERVLVGDLSGKHSHPRLTLPAKLMIQTAIHPLSALIDSGAEQSFIDISLATKLNVATTALPNPLRVSALSGQRLPDITHITEPLSLTLSGNHTERISFFVFKTPFAPLVLGYPWLVQHNPQIDWKKERVTGWSVECHMNCLKTATPPVTRLTTVEPTEECDLSAVPFVYHDLAAVFSKDKAKMLPPHRPYDCAIDLLPGAPLPSGRLYSLTQPERETMEKYITDSLAAGIMRSSSSPVGAGVFFCQQERQNPPAVYRLSWPQQNHDQKQIPAAPSLLCL